MLGCAIAEGLFANKNSLLNGQLCLARKLWVCKNRSVGSLLIRCKFTDINCRSNYGNIIRREEYKPCALQLRHHASYYNRAVQIQTRGFSDAKPYDIETNIDKDVILFKYENPKYFKRMNIFGISQILFWTYLAHFVFTELRDIPVSKMQADDDLPWWRRINFGEATHRTILTGFTFFVGFGLFALAWTHTVKSVRYLILRKGGNDVTFVTYSPFGENRLRTIPLNKMTSKQSREAATVQLPLKVQGDWMHYLLDMRGEFKHPRLFDFTAGLKRPI